MTPETPRQLLDRLRAMGVECRVEGSRLKVTGWRLLSPDDRQSVNQHRASLVALLDAERRQSVAATPPHEHISPRDYASLGLYRSNGTVTHAEGDAVAADILAGRISRSAAEAMQQQAERSAHGLANARLWRP